MKNKYEIRGDYAAIFLKIKGISLETIINTSDFEKAASFPNVWRPHYKKETSTYYVMGQMTVKGVRKTIWLHRWLLSTPDGMVVDHRNHNGLNNRRKNIRNVTHAENMQNRKSYAAGNKSSGMRGVSWHRGSSKWAVRVHVNKKTIYVGEYEDINEAEQMALQARTKYMTHSEEVGKVILNESLKLGPDPNKSYKVNKIGVRGVSWDVCTKKWKAQIQHNKKAYYLGVFSTIEEAELAYKKARDCLKNSIAI